MDRTKNLANRIERTFTGPMWHGAALTHVVEDVTPDRAAAYPMKGAHSIWEIVLHVTVWVDIARQRLTGQSTADPPPHVDWPPPASDPQFASDPDGAWKRAIDRLGASHRELAADVRALPDARLDELVPGLKYTVETLLAGVVEHGTYHGGQIALLRKP